MKTHNKIIIVDDNNQFREYLKQFIERELKYVVIAEASDGTDFLELPNIHDADIVLMDIAMERMNGFEACKRVLNVCYNTKLIAVTMHTEKVFLLNLVESGFKGCVFKSRIFEDLARAIETVMNGKYCFPEGIRIE